MTEDDQYFEVLPAGKMREKYGLYAENRPLIKLDESRVPEPLKPLIPLAEIWGISDDLIREDFIAKASKAAVAELVGAVDDFEDALNEWLASLEASKSITSAEYSAFASLQLAALSCKSVVGPKNVEEVSDEVRKKEHRSFMEAVERVRARRK